MKRASLDSVGPNTPISRSVSLELLSDVTPEFVVHAISPKIWDNSGALSVTHTGGSAVPAQLQTVGAELCGRMRPKRRRLKRHCFTYASG